MIDHLELLVEEPSAEALLTELLPRFLSSTTFKIHPHRGKPDLLRKLPDRLRAYAAFLPETSRVIVLVDRDRDDCIALKKTLTGFAPSRLQGSTKRLDVVSRIAIEELESWYFGDWDAVRAAFPNVSGTIPLQAAYRHPDAIAGGTWEAFERLLRNAGYMSGGLRKIEAAREIGRRMLPSRNSSPSFRTFWNSVI